MLSDRVHALAILLLAAPYPERLAAEQATLEAAIAKKCPEARARIAETRAGGPKAARCEALRALARCGEGNELYHLQTGAACLAVNDFAGAERSYRAALAIRVTEAAQVALLTAIARQEPRSAAQKADLAKHLAYFETHPCSRDDLCASLCYAAWHLDDHALTTRAAERAIALGFPGWQPYFFGGSALALGKEREKAKRWLLEAKKRGAPSAVDQLLSDLGD